MQEKTVIFDTLLYTRTFSEDYKWHFRPDYPDVSLEIMLDPLLRMREDPKNDLFFRKKGKNNFFFLTGKSWLAIICLYTTEEKDSYGRRISRLEGICCPASMQREMSLFIPVFLCDMFNPENDLAIGFYFPGGKLKSQLEIFNFSAAVNACSISDLETELAGGMTDPVYNGFLSRIVDNMQRTGAFGSWILGTESKEFYSLKTNTFFSLYHEQELYSCETPEEKYTNYASPPQVKIFCQMKCYLGTDKEDGYSLDTIVYTDTERIGIQEGCLDDVCKKGIWIDELNNVYQAWQKSLYLSGKGYYLKSRKPEWKELISSNRIALKSSNTFCSKNHMSFEYDSIRITGLETYLQPEYQFKTDIDQIMLELFKTEYLKHRYGDDDSENALFYTIYIINQPEGIYLFWFSRNKKKRKWTYQANGAFLKEDICATAWSCLPELTESICEFLIPSSTGRVNNENALFMEQWQSFRENRGKGIENSIISGECSKIVFPEIGIDRFYCLPENNENTMKIGSETLIRYLRQSLKEWKTLIRICRKPKGVGSSWLLTGYVPANFNTNNNRQQLKPVSQTCRIIDKNSSFEFDDLIEAADIFTHNLDTKGLYQCPVCGSANVSFSVERDEPGFPTLISKKCCDPGCSYITLYEIPE